VHEFIRKTCHLIYVINFFGEGMASCKNLISIHLYEY